LVEIGIVSLKAPVVRLHWRFRFVSLPVAAMVRFSSITVTTLVNCRMTALWVAIYNDRLTSTPVFGRNAQIAVTYRRLGERGHIGRSQYGRNAPHERSFPRRFSARATPTIGLLRELLTPEFVMQHHIRRTQSARRRRESLKGFGAVPPPTFSVAASICSTVTRSSGTPSRSRCARVTRSASPGIMT
jgi:hypothetical protein